MPIEDLLYDSLTSNLKRVVQRAESASMGINRQVMSMAVINRFEELYQWLMDNNNINPFSFVFLCTFFGLDHEYVRKRMLKENPIIEEVYRCWHNNEKPTEPHAYKLSMGNTTLSRAIKTYMKEHGVTYDKLAAEIGVAPSTVTHWVSKITFPVYGDYIPKLAKLLDIEDKVEKIYKKRVAQETCYCYSKKISQAHVEE